MQSFCIFATNSSALCRCLYSLAKTTLHKWQRKPYVSILPKSVRSSSLTYLAHFTALVGSSSSASCELKPQGNMQSSGPLLGRNFKAAFGADGAENLPKYNLKTKQTKTRLATNGPTDSNPKGLARRTPGNSVSASEDDAARSGRQLVAKESGRPDAPVSFGGMDAQESGRPHQKLIPAFAFIITCLFLLFFFDFVLKKQEHRYAYHTDMCSPPI